MKKRFLIPFLLACVGLSACADSLVDVDVPDYSDVSVELNANSLSISIGESTTVEAQVDGTESYRWVNADPSIVSLTYTSTTATITGVAKGEGRIWIFAGDSSAYCDVVVAGGSGGGSTVVVSSLTLDAQNKSVDYAYEEQRNFVMTATVHATGAANISWVSSNDDVATVEKQSLTQALVTVHKAGFARIIASAGGKQAECSLTVVDTTEETFSVSLNKSNLTLDKGAESNLVATIKPANLDAQYIEWQSDTPSVATIDATGKVVAVAAGKANISVTITDPADANNKRTASCAVVVKDDSSTTDYSWSQKGHLYMHYLRNTDTNYDKWALWMWQSYPKDLGGSLWGANAGYDQKGIVPQTYGYMTNAECGGSGDQPYEDENGRIIDVDLTDTTIVDGKAKGAGKDIAAPLVNEEVWADQTKLNKAAIGFLIVDQSKMTGETMWTSDGGAETYIKKLGKNYLPDGKESFVHIYCVEGNVSNFTSTSGKQEVVNPTVTDTTGQYRSKNDITDLKRDFIGSGTPTSTSTSFLNDRPGVGYQIFVPSFADSDGDGFGDIKGITNKLDYIKNDLGAEVLWLTPIQESNSYHGYDVTDYYKIDPKFGTLEDYQELLYEAHERGMKVLMDMVINHTSKSNVLFQKSQRAETEVLPNGKTINYRDMYLWKFKGDKILQWDQNDPTVDAQGNKHAHFDTVNVETSSDWYQDGTSDYYYYGKFGSGMAELNYSCQATRDYMTDMCKYWLSFGLDGFRLDAIKHIYLVAELDPTYNTSGDYITTDVGMRTYYNTEMLKEVTVPNDYTYDRDLNVKFWKEFAGVIKSAYPNCFLVGENFDGWNERIAPFYESMDSQFDFSTYYHLHESTEQGIVAMGGDLQATLGYNNGYRGNHINGAFTSNHDVARMMNHCASTNQKEHHAEINSLNVETALWKARWDAAITILCPGVSWIYYGDEIGIGGNTADKVMDKNGEIYDDHGNNVDRWYRQPMRWADTKGADGGDNVKVVDYTFGGIEVLWDNYSSTIKTVPQQISDPNSLLNHFKALCAAKNHNDYPTYGNIINQWAVDSNLNVLCLQIYDGYRKVNAFINATGNAVSIPSRDSGTWIGGSAGSNANTIPANGFSVVKVN